VGLLDLVEQHDGVGPTAHRLGELATLLVPDVAGGCADEPGDRVPLGVLAHVDADHGALVVEEEVRERLGQLGLADTGRPEEEERAGRPVGVGEPARRAAHRVRDRRTASAWPIRRAPMIDSIEQQLLGLALQQPTGRDAGPGRDDLGDVVGADLAP
jgi:hypothetical protein